MMRLTHGILLVGLAFGLSACSSSGGSNSGQNEGRVAHDFYDPGPLLKEKIQERVDQIPFQQGDALLLNMQWIAQQGEASIPMLLKGLQDEKPKLRSSAAWILGDIGDRRVVEDLRASLGTEQNLIVRLEISRSMVLLGDLRPLPELISGLDAEQLLVRKLCHDVLKETTGRDFGYDHRVKTSAERRESIARWQEWWQETKEDEWFEQRGTQGTPAAPGGR